MRDQSQLRRVLVLGASGKVGRMVRKYWRSNPPTRFLPVYQFRQAAPDDGITWRSGESPDRFGSVSDIVVLWGITAGATDALDDNIRLTIEALDLALALGADKVLLCSSAAVYAPQSHPIQENSGQLCPVSDYGRSKLEAERAAQEWASGREDGPRVCILRLANVIGADSLFASLRKGNVICLDRFESGKGPIRSYIAPSDLARVFERLAEGSPDNLPDVLNVAGRNPVAMQDLAEIASAEITWRPAPATAVPMVSIDASRLGSVVGDLSASDEAERAIADWRLWGTVDQI